jgi:hypothetical protein
MNAARNANYYLGRCVSHPEAQGQVKQQNIDGVQWRALIDSFVVVANAADPHVAYEIGSCSNQSHAARTKRAGPSSVQKTELCVVVDDINRRSFDLIVHRITSIFASNYWRDI